MMHILFLHHGKDWIRGSENNLLLILQNIDRSKFLPFVASNNKLLLQRVSKQSIKTKFIYIPEIILDKNYYKFEVIQYIKFVYFLIRLVMHCDIQVIYSNSGLPTQAGYVASRLSRIPIITHIHSPTYKRLAILWLFKYSDKVLFVSEYIKVNICRKVTFKCEPRVVYNAIDINIFCPSKNINLSHRQSLGITNHDLVVGQVGSLIYRKGCDILIYAFSRLLFKYDNLKLVFVGDGEDSESLHELALQLNIQDNVFFVGNTNDTKAYYQDIIDINVLASRSEAFGIALLEAGACGLPSVASRCGGIPELIRHGENGLLFTSNDSRDLYCQLEILIHNPDLRKQMGVSARKYIEDNFSISKHINTIEQIIENTYYQSKG